MKRVKEARLVQLQLSGSNSENISCPVGLEAILAPSCTIVNSQRKWGKLRISMYLFFAFLAAKPDVRGFLEKRKKITRGRIKINLRMAE